MQRRKLHMTNQREAILDAVRCAVDHPSADDVYETARRSIPSLSLGTVYRNLSQLVDAGYLARVDLPGEPARFDAVMAPHFHVRCTRCARLADVPARVPPALLRSASLASGFAITDCTMDFLGVCPTCQTDL